MVTEYSRTLLLSFVEGAVNNKSYPRKENSPSIEPVINHFPERKLNRIVPYISFFFFVVLIRICINSSSGYQRILRYLGDIFSRSPELFIQCCHVLFQLSL